jgi:exodeoxyribonuclease-3
MRFYTWNVNGFRAVLKAGFMDWLEAADPDVLCLQEIRVEWEQLELSIRKQLESAFDICWFPAQKKGYAGSAVLSKKDLGWQHVKGMDDDEYDAEGRITISTLGNLTLVAGYFPNASEGLVRLSYKRDFSQELTQLMRERHEKGELLIVAGDMNVAPEDIDLARPKDNHHSPGFTDEEREDFRTYLATGVVDVLRKRNPGVPGLYTWWSARGGARSRNVGWRIDHFLVSRDLVARVKEVKIHAEVAGSDHCPLSLDLA